MGILCPVILPATCVVTSTGIFFQASSVEVPPFLAVYKVALGFNLS